MYLCRHTRLQNESVIITPLSTSVHSFRATCTDLITAHIHNNINSHLSTLGASFILLVWVSINLQK